MVQLRSNRCSDCYQIGRKSSTKTYFLYDGDNLVEEYQNGVMTKRYVHGDGMQAPLISYVGGSVTNSSIQFLHTNHQGSVIALSNSEGAVAAINTYDPYGGVGSQTGRFGYTGQMFLPELDLYYYRARIYNPALGRFLQTDPVGYEDQMNLYAYVGNDPVNHNDPTGKFLNFVIGAAIGGGVEVGMQLLKNGGNFSEVDWTDVAVSAAVGTVAPGMLTTGKTVFKSGKAAQTLSKQVNSARTESRRQKLDRRANTHKANIKQAVKVQAGFQAAKIIGKELADVVEEKLDSNSSDVVGQTQQSDTNPSDNGMSGSVVKICSGMGAQKGGC